MASPEFGFIQLQFKQSCLHAYVSVVADGAAGKVRPVNWNAEHNVPPIVVLAVPPRLVWPSMGAALAELADGAEHRARFDGTYCLQARLVVSVQVAGGATPAKLRAQYTTDLTGATGWAYLDGSAGPSADIDAAGIEASSWVNLAAGAKADVLLRIVGIDG